MVIIAVAAATTYQRFAATPVAHAAVTSQIAEFQWKDHNYYGAQATVTVTHIACKSTACNDEYGATSPKFIDQELWLIQNTTSSACPGQCRIEAGYSTRGYDSSTKQAQVWYFWEDLRPNSRAYLHWIEPVPAGDYGHSLTIRITKVYGVSQFYVDMYSYTTSMYNLSQNNTMTANEIDVGSELAGGSSYQSSPTTYFTNNEWYDSGGSPTYQKSNGNGIVYDPTWPPYMGVNVWPSSSSTGGQMYTSCC